MNYSSNFKSIKTIKKPALLISIVILTFFISFGLCEIYLRMQNYSHYKRTYPGQFKNNFDDDWLRIDGQLGWSLNSLPYRNKDLQGKHKRIIFLGDSFVFGVGVSSNKTIPYLLNDKLGKEYKVFNLGVPGYGVDQIYLSYLKYRDIIKPDIIIMGFIDDDVNRTLESYRMPEGLNKPSFRIKDDELIRKENQTMYEATLGFIMSRSIFFSIIMHEIYLCTDANNIVSMIMRKLSEDASDRGARFIIIRIPTFQKYSPYPGFFHKYVDYKSMLQNENILFLYPKKHIEKIRNSGSILYQNDGHLNEIGNELISNYLHENAF